VNRRDPKGLHSILNWSALTSFLPSWKPAIARRVKRLQHRPQEAECRTRHGLLRR